MIHNSCDFSLKETSSLTKLDQDQNPSWINLRSLKDVIRMSSDRGGSHSYKQKIQLDDFADTLLNSSNDQDEDGQVQLPNHVDTPLSQVIEIENIIKNSLELQESTEPAQNLNQFKRKNKTRQEHGSIYSMTEIQTQPDEPLLITDVQPLASMRPQATYHYKNSCSIGHNRNQSQLIDLTKQSLENMSVVVGQQKRVSSTMKVLDEEYSAEDKENLNPYRNKRNNSHYYSEQQKSYNEKRSENICLRIVDKEMNQFDERVEKIKKKMNPLSSRDNSQNRLSIPDHNIRKHSNSSPKKSNTQSLNLSESCSNRSSSMVKTTKTKLPATSQQSSLNLPSAKLSFKRSEKPLEPSQDRDEHKQAFIALKRDNHKLKRQIEQLTKDHDHQIAVLKSEMLEQQKQRMREVEDENVIIREGMKQEYEERIEELKGDMDRCRREIEKEMELMEQENQRKADKKKLKYTTEIEALKEELDQYKQKLVEQTNQKLYETDIMFKTGQTHIAETLQKNQIKQCYMSMQTNRENRLSKLNEEEDEQTPYQSMENFISVKQKAYFNNDISNIAPNHAHNNFFSLSQQDESAMNFSFSEVKTSQDKSLGQFDRNLMVLYTEAPQLERVPQEEDEDDTGELFTSKQPFNYSRSAQSTARVMEDENVKCENSSDDEYETSQHMLPSLSERCIQQTHQQQLYYTQDYEGSENAPEDSGFVSDENDYQERIVNESSLEGDDDMLLMTGRSESAIDEEDEIMGLSKCKAINSSYINLKRNNLLISYGKK